MRAAALRCGMDVSAPRFPAGWWLAVSIAAGVVALAALPAFVGFEGGALVRAAFAPFCHQIPARSPHVHGVPFALCHRCFGIVGGLAAGVALGPLVPDVLRRLAGLNPLLVLGLAVVPTSVDWLLGVAGIWANTGASRLATGALFGLAAGLMLAGSVLASSTQPAVHDV